MTQLLTNTPAFSQGINGAAVPITSERVANVLPIKSQKDTAISSFASDTQTFLKLLTTQLKNQDPLEPTETSEFTNQLVLFTSAEQQIRSNTLLEQLTNLSVENNNSSLLNYLGKKVEVKSNSFSHIAGTSKALEYVLPKDTASSSIAITDTAGNALRTITGAARAGRTKFSWDGKTNAGTAVADGTYRISVNAKDSNAKALSVIDYYTNETITALQRNGTAHSLVAGGTNIDLASITRVLPPT